MTAIDSRPPEWVVLADDLSGAAEVAAGFLGRTTVALSLAPPARHVVGAARVDVLDLDSRTHTGATARAVSEALSAIDPESRVVAKIDSLLRGPVRATVAALRSRGPVVLAAGLPMLDRTIVDAVPYVGGLRLDQTALWAAESTPAPSSIRTLLHGLPVDVGGDPAAPTDGRILVCDVRTDADLDRIVARADPRAVLVGTAALTAAIARTLPRRDREIARPAARHVLTVVGTAAPTAHAQVDHLVAERVARRVGIAVDELITGRADPTELRMALADGSVVVTVGGSVDPASARPLAAALGRFVAAGHGPHLPDLVLTGGETARAVIDALELTTLTPVDEVHYGAVVGVAPDGRRIVTRPGSFGGVDSLTAANRYLTTPTAKETLMSTAPDSTDTDLPVVALTMGDGAGIGPEVIVAALLDPQVATWCRPVVVGDRRRLDLAAEVLGLTPSIVTIGDIDDAVFEPGRINVIDLDLLPADLAWGELSAAAGHAAYEYIRAAGELAVAGKVQAICTAPLNKEALHAAGHIFPGHTELLAHLTGTEEVSMMLSTPKLKVIHVTTHIGLLDAINRIEPGLVERTIRRGYTALVRAGIDHPKIGVCGINPHAGENGLFGYGEEDEKIVPALEALRRGGIDVHGPLPADTAFFLAGRGDYDLIVAMYHDQGHGPVKVLGIEAGVNITVGLPVIRTSVDHGTAFDIAGTGKAEAGSMVEALRQAAELATDTTVVA